MSLINEALKRVKEAQGQAPPSAALGPQLRPVEPVPAPARHSVGWLLPISLVGVALLTLLLVWEMAIKEKPPVAVRAQTDGQTESASANDRSPSPEHLSQITQPITSAPRQAAVATPSAGAGPAPAPNSPVSSAAVAQAKPSPGQEGPTNTNTNTAQVPEVGGQAGTTNTIIAEVQPPKPPPLKLQGIIFSTRPSAVINGKTLFVGDRVREFRVAAITQETAILVSAGRTNVLSLSE